MAAGSMTRYLGGGLVLAIVGATFAVALVRCDGPAGGKVQSVKIGGEWFHVEVAADEKTRMRGLGGRTEIDQDGGMLFVLRQARECGFVMRDCPIPIDIIYLSPEGRVLTMYTMVPEPPRGPNEGKEGDFEQKLPGSKEYDDRLKQYDSRYPTQFVIELKGGRLKTLKVPVKEGDKIDLPYADLKKRVE